MRALGALALAGALSACGFDPHPESEMVACKPEGAACCPEGYLCVGRGVATAGGTSAGTCWSKADLPLAAFATAHDYTPMVAGDPACLVTDWLPPAGGADGGVDSGPADTRPLETGTGGEGGILDAVADVPSGRDTAAETWPGTGGSGGAPDAASDPAFLVDVAADLPLPLPVDGAADLPLRGLDGGAEGPLFLDGRADEGTRADVSVTLDAGPPSMDASAIDSAAAEPLDAPADYALDEAGGPDTGTGRIITSIAAGQFHTCAVINGGAKCWGSNTYGQLGDGSDTERPHPVQVVGLESGVTAIAAYQDFTCAVVAGGATCWGNSNYGELGDGTTTPLPRKVPIQVVGLDSGVTAIAAGLGHACAVVNGSARCWGGGQLGGGPTAEGPLPVQVVGLESGVTAIATGMNHTCALASGAMKCWGSNEFGALGDGTQTLRDLPVQVAGLESGVSAISVGDNYSCAVLNGAAQCWGEQGWYRLGNGSNQNSMVPVQVDGLTSEVSVIISGDDHSCAIVRGGARCWGRSSVGQLGNGDVTTAPSVPVQVLGLDSGVTAITVGFDDSCAVVAGEMKCWGLNTFGELGDGTHTVRSSPVSVGL